MDGQAGPRRADPNVAADMSGRNRAWHILNVLPLAVLDPDIWSRGGAAGLPARQRGRVRIPPLLSPFVTASGSIFHWWSSVSVEKPIRSGSARLP